MSGLLKFITCGSVDDGKSTLIGHILYDSKLLYADQEKALILDSKVGSRGGEIDYSLLLDGLMAEREQGITIDVAYRYFTTDHRSFIVADTPGHEEYTRNMAVGASFAQLAIVMVDAKHGVLVQTRRHARICALMGIKHFVFAVNKMDLVDYSEERFKEIEKDIEELSKALNLYDVKLIPVSATEGDNVTTKSDNMPWYTGEPLLTYLENVDVSENEPDAIFYMPVQRVCRPNHEFRGFQGQIESGKVAVGQTITTLPSNETATVKGILNCDQNVDEAIAGQAVTIQLDREVDVSRGCVLTDKADLPVAKDVTTTLLWMDDDKLALGKEYLVKLGAKKIPGIIKNIEYKIDVNTGEHIEAEYIEKNEIAVCQIEFAQAIVVDEFKKNKTLGELILIDRVSHMTSACGVVESVNTEGEKPYFEKDDIKTSGYIFEEFYFNLENAFLSKANNTDKTYHVGDKVPVEGDSFKYPDYFDILAVDNNAVILIRNQEVQDIIPLSEYQYQGLPVLDERGFALKIRSEADLDNFLYEHAHVTAENRLDFHNKWSKFETYRRIVCTDNFWMI
ncbi:MAG: GTP-binding protein [Lachnospiraceae bacterium]|nr:GTP-binding protein [Lachnospiraceae bacterium]HCJ07607.1 sulfate adenylyltransferase [Lachnospiraceae bacterium]